MPALAEALERCSETTWLCMENAAGTGDTVGRSLEELAAIYDALDGHERLGVCLDSCHLFASGYDVTDAGRARPRGRASSTARSASTACAACT